MARALANGSSPADVWPRKTVGPRDVHFHAAMLSQVDAETHCPELISRTFSRVIVHPDTAGWWAAVRAHPCGFNDLEDCAIVCHTEQQRQRNRNRIKESTGQSIQRQAEGRKLTRPTPGSPLLLREWSVGTRGAVGRIYASPEPPVLLIEELGDRRFDEIFVSPEIGPGTVSREDLLLLVLAARFGLQLIRLPD